MPADHKPSRSELHSIVHDHMQATFMQGVEAWQHWFIREQLPRHVLVPGNPKPSCAFPYIPIADLLLDLERLMTGVALLSGQSHVCRLAGSIQVSARNILRDNVQIFDTSFCDLRPNHPAHISVWKAQAYGWYHGMLEHLCWIKANACIYHARCSEKRWN